MMRSRVRRQCYYDARVNDVNLIDITSSVKNANILRALRDEQPNDYRSSCIRLLSREVEERFYRNDFVIRQGDDIGWLGYFIGKSKCLQSLHIIDLPAEGERIDALMEGIARNNTIDRLYIETDLGIQGFKSLGLLMANMKFLHSLEFSNMNIGSECAHSIASALSQIQHHDNMFDFKFLRNDIGFEDFAAIFGQLASQRELVTLCLEGSDIGRDGCFVVGNMLSSWDTPHLQSLFLEDTSIDDGALQALVKGMSNCVFLTTVRLSGNSLITAAGLRSLSTLFQSENCALKNLYLEKMNIGNDGATALAEGLVENKSLQFLFIDPEIANITSIGWSAFSKLLCDTSSTNSTYLSNHTLQWIGSSDYRDSGAPRNVKIYLDINYQQNRYNNVGTWKILRHHPVFDMMPLFQWKLKFLPLVAKWFESVGNLLAERGIVLTRPTSFESRKLSAVYQFVRGMPLLVIHGYNSRRTNTRMSRKRRLDGETK